MSESLVPMFDFVLVERRVEEKTKGGIILTDDTAKKHSGQRAKVLALGPSCESDLSPGDEVLFGQYAGSWVNTEGRGAARADTKTYIVQETDIIARVKSDG